MSRLLIRLIDGLYRWLGTWTPIGHVSLQTFRYAACGGLNIVLSLALYYIFNHFVVAGRWLDLGFIVVAPHIATLYAIVPLTFFTGFYMNRNVAFTNSPLRTRTQLIRYMAVWAGSLLLNHLLLKLFVEVCRIWNTPSQIIATLLIVVYSYFMQNYFTFRGNRV